MDRNKALKGLTHAVQYRSIGSGQQWVTMAAFDGELAAKFYYEAQEKRETTHWSYRMVDLCECHELSSCG